MSKARKGQKVTDRLQAGKADKGLAQLFDIITIVSLVGFVLVAGGAYVLGMLYSRVIFVIIMYCLVSFGSSFAIGHFIRENPVQEKKYFNFWFGLMVAIVIFLILSLGLPY
ncbi:MAG: hypothetical protein ACTSUE_20815 [Promethearchaeota archaeon]